MEKQICTHPENCVASKTNENINASERTQIHGKSKDKHTQKTTEPAKDIRTQTLFEITQSKGKTYTSTIGEQRS